MPIIIVAIAASLAFAFLMSRRGPGAAPAATNTSTNAPASNAGGATLAVRLDPITKDGVRADALVRGASAPFHIDIALADAAADGLRAEARHGTCAAPGETVLGLGAPVAGKVSTTAYLDIGGMQKDGGAILALLRGQTMVSCGAIPPLAAAPATAPSGPGVRLPDGRRVMPDGTVEVDRPRGTK